MAKKDDIGLEIGNVEMFDDDEDEELDEREPVTEIRYIMPQKPIRVETVAYENAAKMAKAITIEPGDRVDAIIDGSFVFADFICAYLMSHNLHAKRVTISTLGMSERNVEMFKGLMDHGFIQELNLIVSIYFYGNERFALIPYLYKTLDYGDRFQLAVAGVHTKIVTMELDNGQHIVMHGSANLRSSDNVEQFTIEDNKDVFDFYDDFHTRIVERFSTIDKSVTKNRGPRLWNEITEMRFND